MPFCNYSRELSDASYTTLDNVFITNYLPDAPPRYVDIYLFGLYLCGKAADNDVDVMSRVLNVDKEDILTAYTYWEELGLVRVLQKNPYEVVYLPVRGDDVLLKKIKPQKYRQFNKDIQGVISGRLISTNEFNEYYIFLETTFFEPKALVAVARYCAERKGDDINYPYILKVARNLADSGVKTADAVEEKLASAVKYTDDIKLLFSSLGIRRAIEYEDRRLYEKWTEGMGFELETIRHIARKNKKYTMERLDRKLESYYRLGLMSVRETDAYEKSREDLYDLTKEINKIIGVYYQSLDYIIEDYVTPWMQKGFDGEALRLIARYCFKQNIRTLDGMDGAVNRFYKKGLTSSAAIGQYTASVVERDEKIKEVLRAAGLVRGVSSADRNNYKTWTENWLFGDDMLLYAASLSAGANNPMAYMNKILSDFKANNIMTAEEAARRAAPASGNKPAPYKEREYTKEELDALFDNLDDGDQ